MFLVAQWLVGVGRVAGDEDGDEYEYEYEDG